MKPRFFVMCTLLLRLVWCEWLLRIGAPILQRRMDTKEAVVSIGVRYRRHLCIVEPDLGLVRCDLRDTLVIERSNRRTGMYI
jgi:hypothetical protein